MSEPYNIPRLVIAGAASNVGKTTVTTGIIAALRAGGLVVQPFKCGPDYIDPTWHTAAAGRPCRSLDSWILGDAMLLESFVRACRGADVAVIEGVMGLFDGCDWEEERGSSVQIAKLLGAPILLVVDIGAAARSAAVTVLGCSQFDPEVPLAAVALNLAGSEGHAHGCREAISRRSALPVVGWLPRDERLRVPERHLGLIPGGERLDAAALVGRIAEAVKARFDLQVLMAIARGARPINTAEGLWSPSKHAAPDTVAHGPVIAVARDAAFCFYYPENLELLESAGAVVEFFSPIRGEAPSGRAAGLYLGGGYPELHAPALSANAGLWHALRTLRSRDAPIYAECGGFMALTEALVDLDGRRWPMAGLIPGCVRMRRELAALGYRHATALRSNLLVEDGQSLRGHEFRYSTWEGDSRGEEVAAAAWRAGGGSGPSVPTGFADGNLLGSYLHVHFGQRPQIAARFVGRLKPPHEIEPDTSKKL